MFNIDLSNLKNRTRELSIFILVTGTLLSISVLGQSTKKQTLKYSGIYSYGKDVEKGPVGSIIIFPETDHTVLFYLSVCKGAQQGYRLGELYARLKVAPSGQATFFEKYEMEDKGCKWTVKFFADKLEIKTVDNQDGCGFGYGVIADGTYLRTTTETPEFFTDGNGDKIFFKETKPETY